MENINIIDTVGNALQRFNKKIFWIGFVAGLLGVLLTKVGIHLPTIVSPIPFSFRAQKSNVLHDLLPMLHQKKNTYNLKREVSLVPGVFASSLEADYASSYVVIDYETGKVLADKNSSTSLPIASLTKIMSAVVALDLADPSETFLVTDNAARIIPTKIGVIPGEKLTLSELLHAALMTSANDAVEVIKNGVDAKYGGEVFVRAMNEKARFLGLGNTHFSNPQGFDSKTNYSTAEDLAVLSHYALTNYPLIDEIVKKDYTVLSQNYNHKQFDLYNWNGLIGVYPGVSGLKIGNTEEAGSTTVVVSARENRRVLAVLLGAPGVLERDLWAAQLLDTGFKKLAALPDVSVTGADLKAKYATWHYWN